MNCAGSSAESLENAAHNLAAAEHDHEAEMAAMTVA
jgi:hypothetical protein